MNIHFKKLYSHGGIMTCKYLKKTGLFVLILTQFCFFSCVKEIFSPRVDFDYISAKNSYTQPLTISPNDNSVNFSRGLIRIEPSKESQTYTISGYFNGQIYVATKNTIIKLNNVYLENTMGKPAILSKSKFELSSAKDSVNYIIGRGRSFSKTAAVKSKKDFVLGGSGTLYIKGNVRHAILADDMKMKGSHTLYCAGTSHGSAILCNKFTVEPEKTFNAYLLNSKNGINADNSIKIDSGNFYLYDNETALKTETSNKKERKIKLTGGTFHIAGNENLYKTNKKSYDASGAEFIQESNNEEEN